MLREFLDYLENEVSHGSIYVWGGQGQKATDILIDRLETSEANKKTAKALLKKRVKAGFKEVRAFDCSGLVTKAMDDTGIEKKGFDTTAQMLRVAYCTQISREELKPGDLVFRKNAKRTYHVGVVADERGNVIEARGRAYGVVKRALNASGKGYWNAYGRPKKLAQEIESQVKRETISRNLAKKAILMRGTDVKSVQEELISRGYSTGKRGADAAYGKETEAAVKRFQKDNGLKQDGIVGKNTAEKLGFIWKER